MSLSPQQLQELLETSKRLKKPTLSVVSQPQALPPSPKPLPPPQAFVPAPTPVSAPTPTPVPEPPPMALPPVPSAPEPTVSQSPSTVPEDFSAFSGLPKRQPSLPRGAKNVKCHTVERDPDTGKIARVYTYDLEEEPQSGDQIPRQLEE